MHSCWENVFSHGGQDLKPETYCVDVHDIIDAGPDTLIVLAHYTGDSVRSGGHHRIQVAHVWTFKNGRIKEFRQYTDTCHMQHFDEIA